MKPTKLLFEHLTILFKGKTIECLVVAFLLAGCRSGALERGTTPTVEPQPSASEASRPSPSPSERTASPTGIPAGVTPPVITRTSLPILTTTANPTWDPGSLPIKSAETRCLSLTSPLPANFLSDGEIIFGDFTERQYIGKLFISQDDELHYLADAPPSMSPFEDTSPGGQWFLYKTIDWTDDDYKKSLVILSATGEEPVLIPWENEWGFARWLDDEQIVIPHLPPHLSTTDILNPFTNEQQTLAPDLPDFYFLPEYPILRAAWNLVYDPTLTRVVYIAFPGGEEHSRLNLVVWDLEANQESWRLYKRSTIELRPAWSDDGSKLAVVALNEREHNWDLLELYIVSRDGEAVQWLDLAGYYPDSLVVIKWSPDGRYLAIAPFGGGGDNLILILDTTTRRLFDYCLAADATNGMIWSPDSTQVIVQNWGARALILDLEQEAAAYLVENEKHRPLGWLTSSP